MAAPNQTNLDQSRPSPLSPGTVHQRLWGMFQVDEFVRHLQNFHFARKQRSNLKLKVLYNVIFRRHHHVSKKVTDRYLSDRAKTDHCCCRRVRSINLYNIFSFPAGTGPSGHINIHVGTSLPEENYRIQPGNCPLDLLGRVRQ